MQSRIYRNDIRYILAAVFQHWFPDTRYQLVLSI